jgi:hypothetical protein
MALSMQRVSTIELTCLEAFRKNDQVSSMDDALSDIDDLAESAFFNDSLCAEPANWNDDVTACHLPPIATQKG